MYIYFSLSICTIEWLHWIPNNATILWQMKSKNGLKATIIYKNYSMVTDFEIYSKKHYYISISN